MTNPAPENLLTLENLYAENMQLKTDNCKMQKFVEAAESEIRSLREANQTILTESISTYKKLVETQGELRYAENKFQFYKKCLTNVERRINSLLTLLEQEFDKSEDDLDTRFNAIENAILELAKSKS